MDERRARAKRRGRYYDARVPEPTVVILAAGEGTRMRSAVPKVLHPLCGRPLIAWPVAAAREAGAAQRDRRRQPQAPARGAPARRRRDRDPAGAEGDRRRGRGRRRADRRRPTRWWSSTATCALLTAEAIAQARRGPRGGRRGRHDGDDGARRARRATGASSASSDGSVERVAEAKGGAGDATPEELEIREVNTGVYAFDGGALIAALTDARHRQRPGRALPARRPARDARRRQAPSPRTRSATPTSRTASTTASTSPTPTRSRSGASTSSTCAAA